MVSVSTVQPLLNLEFLCTEKNFKMSYSRIKGILLIVTIGFYIFAEIWAKSVSEAVYLLFSNF